MNKIQLSSNSIEICKTCGKSPQELEIANTDLMIKQENLLAKLKKAKEELAEVYKELHEKEIVPEEENLQTIFNANSMNTLQDLLDQAEENEQMLLFVDSKQNTWELIQRRDINIPNDSLSIKIDETQKEEEKL